jgi:tetratricopeptide (TPR) repeat protein
MNDQERCPRCGGQVFPAARFCPRCGAALAPEEHTTDSEAPPPGGGELNAWEWNNKGVALSRLGRYQEALECYNEALEIDPGNALAQKGKRMALEKRR